MFGHTDTGMMAHSAQPVIRHGCLAGIDCFVLAGGLGTRIRSVVGDTPKLLAPIGERNYLSYLLDWLTCFGAQRIVLGLGYRAEAILTDLERHPRNDVSIITVSEPEPLGTAGALAFSRDRLRSDPVLALNGDTFVDADLCEFVSFYRSRKPLGALLCCKVPDGSRYGRVCIDAEDHIERFVEKDGSGGAATVSAGVYLLSAALLDTIRRTTKGSLEYDVFRQLAPGSLQAFSGNFEFIDIGTPESLTSAAHSLSRFPLFNHWAGDR